MTKNWIAMAVAALGLACLSGHIWGCDISGFTASTTNSRINVSWSYAGGDCTNQTMHLSADNGWDPHYADVPVTNGFYQFVGMRGGTGATIQYIGDLRLRKTGGPMCM
jgi:hypothetical protein